MTNERLPYKDNDDDDVLAVPCAVCGDQVPIWNRPDYTKGDRVYCKEHTVTQPRAEDNQ